MQQAESNDDDDGTSISIAEQYSDGTVHYDVDGRDAQVFIEAIEVTAARVEHDDHPRGMSLGDTFYYVGVFDTSIGSHPVIEERESVHRTRKRAVAAMLELAADLDQVLADHRGTDAYQRAIEVEERAPKVTPGTADDHPPRFLLSQQQDRVYSGRKSVEEAVADLEDEISERNA